MEKCTECFENISEDAITCPKCGSKNPFDAVVVMDLINNHLYDIRSTLSLYYKKGYFYIKNRTVYEFSDVVLLVVYSLLFYFLAQGFWSFGGFDILANKGILSVSGLSEYEIYELKSSISDKAFSAFFLFLVMIYIPFFRVGLNKYDNNDDRWSISFGVNSYRKAMSKTGNIYNKYKTSLSEDDRIFKEDNKYSDGAFDPCISYTEKPSNPVTRALERINNIKQLLITGDGRYVKFDLDIKSYASYLTKHPHLFDIIITAIVSVVLSIIYCTATGISYNIAGAAVGVSILLQISIIVNRRHTNLIIFSVVDKLEKQLVEIELNHHKNDLTNKT